MELKTGYAKFEDFLDRNKTTCAFVIYSILATMSFSLAVVAGIELERHSAVKSGVAEYYIEKDGITKDFRYKKIYKAEKVVIK